MPALADLISVSRLAVAPILPVVATLGYPRATAALIMWGLASDAIDGAVARMTGVQSDRGARLDSLCDVAFYSMAIVAFVISFPVARMELFGTFLVTGASLILPSIVGWLKFAAIPSYHTVLSRLVLVAFGIALLAFLLGGLMWQFRIAAALAVLAAIDDILITILLDRPTSLVPHSLILLRQGTHNATEPPTPIGSWPHD